MTYELWDKISQVNGMEAIDLIGQEQMENDDPFVLFKDASGAVVAIESMSTMKTAYALNGDTWEEIAAAYVTMNVPTLDEFKAAKADELFAAYETSLYTTVTYLDKLFGNTKTDQDTVDEVIWTIDEGMFPGEGMDWNTYQGSETVFLTKAEIKGLKGARIMQKQALWQRFLGLSAANRAATTNEEVAAVIW